MILCCVGGNAVHAIYWNKLLRSIYPAGPHIQFIAFSSFWYLLLFLYFCWCYDQCYIRSQVSMGLQFRSVYMRIQCVEPVTCLGSHSARDRLHIVRHSNALLLRTSKLVGMNAASIMRGYLHNPEDIKFHLLIS